MEFDVRPSSMSTRSRALVLTTVAASAAAAFLVVQGCSSSDDGGATNTTAAPGQPPARPNGGTASSDEHNYAVKEVFVGDRTRAGVKSGDAWKAFGFNVDGVDTKAAGQSCKSQSRAATDGDNGIDNAFGGAILPIILPVQKDVADIANQTIKDGKFTLMFDIFGLNGEANQTATGLSGNILPGGSMGKAPTFTKADDWPVVREILSDPSDPRSSTIKLNDAYVVDGTFVYQGNATVSLRFGGNDISLALKKAAITMDHSGVGMIGGAIKATDLVTELKKIVGNINPALCNEATIAPVLQQILDAADIMADGSAGSPDQDCDGISVGLGFTAAEIGLPKSVAPAVGDVPDPCAGGAETDGGM